PRSKPPTASVTWPAPFPTTTTVRSALRGAAAASTCQSSGRPATGCSGLGTAQREGLPPPAAGTTKGRPLPLAPGAGGQGFDPGPDGSKGRRAAITPPARGWGRGYPKVTPGTGPLATS